MPTARERLSWLLRPAGGGLYLVSTGKREQQALQRRFYAADTEEDVTHAFELTLDRIKDANVVVLGIPSDVGAGFRRGANLGPQAIRTQLLADDPDWAPHCERRGILDVGDVFVVPQLLSDEMLAPSQLASAREALYPDLPPELRAQQPVSPLSIAEHALGLMLEINPNLKPFILGGDHSCAWPVVKALHARGRRFCIVQPDAHTDLMPQRLGIEICFATWSYHANELLGRQGRMIQVGVRASQRPKDHWEETLDVRQLWADEILRSPNAALERTLALVKETKLPVYFSNDIDGTDSRFADACGTPEPDGLDVTWVRELISRLGRECGLVGGDVMEVAPLLGMDGGAGTVKVAATYARDTLDALAR
ncbi:MAG TPA: arginase family protein [Polyangiaceae bacterium]|jgi:agmatinase|nr:arginase family protein [Polyangiaceae bacterium]